MDAEADHLAVACCSPRRSNGLSARSRSYLFKYQATGTDPPRVQGALPRTRTFTMKLPRSHGPGRPIQAPAAYGIPEYAVCPERK